MRFSFWPTPSLPFDETQALAQHVEKTGWDGLWLADHFMPMSGDLNQPQPEAWTTLAALASTVPRIRMGTLVSGNTYRNPAVLAKMAATLDHISQGRCVLGLGSGWQQNEHEAYGIAFDTVAIRLQRLAESCEIIKSLFANETTTFNGKHYQLLQAPLAPKPLQANLPLMIGGGGEKVTLKIVAKFADEWNVWGDVKILQDKMKILDQHCQKVQRDPASIQRSAVALLFLSDDEAYIKRMKSTDIGRPSLIGNVNELRDIVAQFAEAGVDELIVPDFTLGKGQRKLDTLDLFQEEVASVIN